MEKVNFEEGQLIKPATVTIDGTEHQVTPAQRAGATPLSAHVLNLLQDNIEEEIELGKEEAKEIIVSVTEPTRRE